MAEPSVEQMAGCSALKMAGLLAASMVASTDLVRAELKAAMTAATMVGQMAAPRVEPTVGRMADYLAVKTAQTRVCSWD